MAFGLSDQGFQAKRLADIKTELEADFRALFGPGINLTAQSPLGQIIGIIAERETFVWEELEKVYASQYPDTAEGASLDGVAALTGTTRLPALASKVTARIFGTETSPIVTPFVLSVVGDNTARFAADAGGVVGPSVDEVQDIDFSGPPSSGDFVLDYQGQQTVAILFSDSAATLEAALEALSTIGVGNVTVSGDFTAGFTVNFTGALAATDADLLTVFSNTLDGGLIAITIVETLKGGPPHVDLAFTAEQTGPIAAPAGSLTVIETPQAGITSANNFDDADLGNDVETDSELKIRRNQQLKRAGTATLEGIRNNVLLVEFVQQALVQENTDIVTGPSGIPPKAFETFATGGDEQEIAQAIFDAKPIGIEAHGSITLMVTDSQGVDHTIKFSRPTDIDVWLEIDVVPNTDPNEGAVYPADGDQSVKQAVLDFTADFRIGQDVIVNQLFTPINEVAGVIGIVIRLGFAPAPVGTVNLDIDATEIAQFDSSRIIVTQV